MRKLVASVAGAVTFCLAGCSIHPLPEDVTPLNTVQIVDHIRCEMRDAVRKQIIFAFRQSKNPRAQQIADDLEQNSAVNPRVYLKDVKYLADVFQKRIAAFDSTTIGYGFRFNITEKNLASGAAGFTLPYALTPIASLSLGIGGGAEKTRANTRRFFKVETFEELVFTNDCNDVPQSGPNFAYPITGTIGLANVVDDFVKLTTRGAQLGPGKDVPNFSEQLEFTTRVFGNINPSVRIGAVADAFKLTDANLNLAAERTDIHELTVTFALDKELDQKTLAATAPRRRQAVIDELRSLRNLDAIERGGTVVP